MTLFGQWAIVIRLLMAALLFWMSFRDKYLLAWLGGWVCLLLSRAGKDGHQLPVGFTGTFFPDLAFLLAVALFAIAALYYTDSRRQLKWMVALATLGVLSLVVLSLAPASFAAAVCYQAAYHGMAALAAVRLLFYGMGRLAVGPWAFAVTLLSLHSGFYLANAPRVSSAYPTLSESMLHASILLMVLEESRTRARRLELMNTITVCALGGDEYEKVVLTAMREMCHLYGARCAWFQMVEGESLILKQQFNLPEYVSAPRRRVALAESVLRPLLTSRHAVVVQVRSLTESLRSDLERAGMNYLVLVPVFGKTNFLGNLAFGLSGRRFFSREQLRFLTATANQLGMAGERRIGEEHYRLLFDSVQEGVFVTTPDGRLIDCNPALVSMLGYGSRAEMLGVNIGTALFLNSEQRARYREEMERNGALRNYEIELRRKDGQTVMLLENSFATRDSEGNVERYQGFLLDITEQKRVEEGMKRYNRELAALNAMATMATRTFDLDAILQDTLHWTVELFQQNCDIFLFDPETIQITRIDTTRPNREREREVLRRLVEEQLGETIRLAHHEIITEDDLSRLPQSAQEWIAGCGFRSFLCVVIYSQLKSMGMLLISSAEAGRFEDRDRRLATAIARQLGNSVEKVMLYEETAAAYEDLSNAQEQLLQSEKMSAVGQLVSGVAHELNNPLTAILGYAQLLEGEPLSQRAQDYVRKLYRQTQRTHRVVQNLLSFSRQRKPIQSKVDVRTIMNETLSLRESDLRLNNIAVERQYDAVPFIVGDAFQLEQVFLNILNNAVDAIMDSDEAGKITIRIFTGFDLVCVEVRDSGPGVKQPGKIFDPFYTTKKLGKGTGLGLSICYGIVKEHGGEISASNHEQGGASFLIELPIARAKAAAAGEPVLAGPAQS